MFVWVRVPFPVLIKLTMKQYYRKFKQGIGNLIYYFKVIWNDRQWDYAFFYRLELKKELNGSEFVTDEGTTVEVHFSV